MFVKCKDILSLPSLKASSVVAGTSGLDRIIRWLYIAECFNDSRKSIDWLYGGELVFITGVGLNGSENDLIEFISRINEKNVAGLIINIGEFIPKIPRSAIELADKLNFPLFELPWDVKLVDVSQDICNAIITKKLEKDSINNLLDNILFSNVSLNEDLVKKAEIFNYDISDKSRIGIIDFENFPAYLKKKGISDQAMINNLKDQLQKIVYDTFLNYNHRVITMQKNNSIIFMIKVDDLKTEWLISIIEKIKTTISIKFNKLNFRIGIGNAYTRIEDLRKSFQEAEKALQISKCENELSKPSFYQYSSIYNLLLNINDEAVLNNFSHDILGSLLEYDKINNSCLTNTLEIFLRENCNIVIAASKLFIHKNTLKYRIQKIEEILNCDLSNINDCAKLDIAFKIVKLVS
jgi:DNA-binding PucR family transcriptional regulator